jgi:hypothetical protein
MRKKELKRSIGVSCAHLHWTDEEHPARREVVHKESGEGED